MKAENPESGAVEYRYDANGNLKTKKDGRQVMVSYTYDELNRVKTHGYSDARMNDLSIHLLPFFAPKGGSQFDFDTRLEYAFNQGD